MFNWAPWKKSKTIGNAIGNASPGLRVFAQFRPFVRLLQAYRRDHFHRPNRRDRVLSAFYALYASLTILLTPVLMVSIVWSLISSEATAQKYASALPIVFSLLQTGLTFVALIWQNGIITEAIRQLQAVVDRREYSAGFVQIGPLLQTFFF